MDALTIEYIELLLREALAGNRVKAFELFNLMEKTHPLFGNNPD